jgi:hypothetical protein
VSTYEVGDGVTLRHTITNGDGELTAATVTLTVKRPDDTTFQPGVSSPSTGVYESEQIIADPAGLWTFLWSATGTVVDNTPGAFIAVDPATTGWATTGEVLAVTGQTVTPAQVMQAQAVIEAYAGRSEEAAEYFTGRDRWNLKRAVCWQAAWLTEQVAYPTRSTFQIQVQDGMHHHVNTPSDLQLAPLAKLHIKRLSWFGNRSVVLKPVAEAGFIAFNNEASDHTHPWEALPL